MGQTPLPQPPRTPPSTRTPAKLAIHRLHMCDIVRAATAICVYAFPHIIDAALHLSAGGLQDVLASLATDLCQHALDLLLKLHPGRVSFQAKMHQENGDLSTIEVSFGSEAATQQQGSYTVEEATLQCLQIFTGKQCFFGIHKHVSLYKAFTSTVQVLLQTSWRLVHGQRCTVCRVYYKHTVCNILDIQAAHCAVSCS